MVRTGGLICAGIFSCESAEYMNELLYDDVREEEKIAGRGMLLTPIPRMTAGGDGGQDSEVGESPSVGSNAEKTWIRFCNIAEFRKNVILEQLCPFLFYFLYGIMLLLADEMVNVCKSAKCID